MIATVSFWSDVLPTVPNIEWQAVVQRIAHEAETRRARADYDTGSITELEAYLLRALAERLTARVIIEVGTFIGTSTCALASAPLVTALYTCDASNDCLPSTEVMTTFPKATSTQMLRTLADRGVCADLCFFDGVLSEPDIDLLARVTGPQTVFAVHDYNYGPKRRVKHGVMTLETMPRKGIGNVRLLQRQWPSHGLVAPMPETTLAVLVPRSRL